MCGMMSAAYNMGLCAWKNREKENCKRQKKWLNQQNRLGSRSKFSAMTYNERGLASVFFCGTAACIFSRFCATKNPKNGG